MEVWTKKEEQGQGKTLEATPHDTMTEAQWQRKLIEKHEAEGWYVIKLMRANKSGLPDLIMLKPDKVLFIEAKASDGVVSPIQKYRIEELRDKGFTVDVSYAPV